MLAKVIRGFGFPKQSKNIGAISPQQTFCPFVVKERIAGLDVMQQIVAPIDREITAGQSGTRGPFVRQVGKEGRKTFERGFSQFAVGGDFTTKDVQQRRSWCIIGQRNDVIAGGGSRRGGAIIVKGAHTRKAPDDLIDCHGLCKIIRGKGAKIFLFFGRANCRRIGIRVGRISGADQGKVGLVGDGKNDPPVLALEKIGAVVVKQAGHYDVAAAHQPDAFICLVIKNTIQQFLHPRTTSINQRTRIVDSGFPADHILGGHFP